MIKLKELNEEYIEWYFNKIKDEVHSRITNCISLFNGTEKIIDNSNFLSLLKFIEINIVNFKDKTSNYLIGNNLKNIISFSRENFQQEFILPSTLLKEKLNISAKKRELLNQFNSICSLVNWETLNNNLTKPIILEYARKLKKQLDILKKISNFCPKQNNQNKEQNQIIIKMEYFFKYIFDYDILDKKVSNVTLRHQILAKMNVKTCPYCDRQYITNFDINKSSADLDHFYSQSEYPYLALNIYNFIPACPICNRNFKNDVEIQVNPRFEEFGNNAIFTIKNKLISYMDMNLEDIDIEIDIKNQELETKINSNINTFKLKEIYKVHCDYIYQLIKDINFRSNKNYINDISDLINSNDNQYKDKILEELILQPYKFKIENNEPLGKLTKDILNELIK